MNPNQLRMLSTIGTLVALVLCVLYVIRTYKAGEIRWYFVIMAVGILLMFVYGFIAGRKKK